MHIICLSVKAHDHAVICILHIIADFVLLCNLTLFLHGLYTDITWQRFVTVKCVVLFVCVCTSLPRRCFSLHEASHVSELGYSIIDLSSY